MKILKVLSLSLCVISQCGAAVPCDATLYNEPYRPQYHFTPAHRWIGDPCGLVKHQGRYLAYSWGGAVSDDLLHWTELNDHAFTCVPDGISTFTGSVVVDSAGTAGYGKNALIAAFTSFDESSKKQSQSIAFSLDGGVTYRYYDLNPVVDIWSTEFRDPTVIRDDRTGKWVMIVAKALEKKVAFYRSDDLKHWEWTSDFGPMGDSERSWECPDLFRLPVEGSDEWKWVLLVSVNWAREQYFVGDFDGERFIPDAPDAAPLYVDAGFDYYASRVFQDYDNPRDSVYTLGWVNTWDYAQQAPSTWGKGVWSLPRAMSLRVTADGLRLRQRPVAAIESLRGRRTDMSFRLRPGVTPLSVVGKMGNVYEIDAVIEPRGDDTAGFNLCCGEGRKISVSYDGASGCLVVDRTNCSAVEIPKFDRIAHVKVPEHDGKIGLRIFVDRSTVEIFVNDGETVLTMLTYPGVAQTGAELFSLRGGTSVTLSAWPLASVH